jgi:hypothetical protein
MVQLIFYLKQSLQPSQIFNIVNSMGQYWHKRDPILHDRIQKSLNTGINLKFEYVLELLERRPISLRTMDR